MTDTGDAAYDPLIAPHPRKRSRLVQLVLKTGIVQTSQQAHQVLLVVAGLFFLISLYLFFSTFREGALVPPPPEEDILTP